MQESADSALQWCPPRCQLQCTWLIGWPGRCRHPHSGVSTTSDTLFPPSGLGQRSVSLLSAKPFLESKVNPKPRVALALSSEPFFPSSTSFHIRRQNDHRRPAMGDNVTNSRGPAGSSQWPPRRAAKRSVSHFPSLLLSLISSSRVMRMQIECNTGQPAVRRITSSLLPTHRPISCLASYLTRCLSFSLFCLTETPQWHIHHTLDRRAISSTIHPPKRLFLAPTRKHVFLRLS